MELPYGSWPSRIDTELITASSVRLGEVVVDGADIWWAEMRPEEDARVVLVCRRPDGTVEDRLDPGISARTRVHEYGGGAWTVSDSTVYTSSWADQRLYRQSTGGTVEALSPEPSATHGFRFADGVITPDGRSWIGVRETHAPDGSEAANEIVSIGLSLDLDGPTLAEPQVLVSGPDFVAAPRVSPDGQWLAWIQWDHPRMPWDGTELCVAPMAADGELTDAVVIAGGEAESITEPRFGADGRLWFCSDRSDWWNLYRLDDLPHGDPKAVCPMEAEIGGPHWVFGLSTYAVLPGGRVVAAATSDGIDGLVVIEPNGLSRPLDTPYSSISSLVALGERGVVFVGASPAREPAVVQLDLGTGAFTVLREPRDLGIDPGYLSTPRSIEFPTENGLTAHGIFYPPCHPDVSGPPDERPPLVVMIHGGPTSAARTELQLGVHFWTSRGLAVVDVNYGGSTGYGRRYRDRLQGAWGVVDVEDCINAARWLAEQGEVDGDRLAIRGGSAGGFTTLAAMAFHDVFAAGASHYGVADLGALAKETHKFESRYLDSLVGPWPEAKDIYDARSPIENTDGLSAPLILFQGLEDEIVPPNQAEMMAEALRSKGVPFAYVTFEGEQHGFRQAKNIRRALEAELYFYSRVFGFELADSVDPVEIENADALVTS